MIKYLIQKPKIIKVPQSKIIKLLTVKKNKTLYEEIYIVQINQKTKKKWRKHLNSNKILFCIKGEIKILIKNKKKIFTKKINDKNNLIINIKKNTFFKFSTTSKGNSLLLVFSEKKNSSIKSVII